MSNYRQNSTKKPKNHGTLNTTNALFSQPSTNSTNLLFSDTNLANSFHSDFNIVAPVIQPTISFPATALASENNNNKNNDKEKVQNSKSNESAISTTNNLFQNSTNQEENKDDLIADAFGITATSASPAPQLSLDGNSLLVTEDQNSNSRRVSEDVVSHKSQTSNPVLSQKNSIENDIRMSQENNQILDTGGIQNQNTVQFQTQKSGVMNESTNNNENINSYQVPNVRPHWFYSTQKLIERVHPGNLSCNYNENKNKQSEMIQNATTWSPLSRYDTIQLEEGYQKLIMKKNNRSYRKYDSDDDSIYTDGGRYEIDLEKRTRKPIYWTSGIERYNSERSSQNSETNNKLTSYIMRATWFYRKDGEYQYFPFNEVEADVIENFYVETCNNNIYPQRKEVEAGNFIVVQSPEVVIQWLWNADFIGSDNSYKGSDDVSQWFMRVLKRGITDTHFEDDIGFGGSYNIFIF